MTKKHFIALADVIRDFNSDQAPEGQFNKLHLVALARFCQYQNPQFNRERWLAYIARTVGPNGGKR